MEKSIQETKLIQEIEKRRKEQNEFRKQTDIEIKQRVNKKNRNCTEKRKKSEKNNNIKRKKANENYLS